MAKPNQERLRTKLRKLLPSPVRNDYGRPAQIWRSKKKGYLPDENIQGVLGIKEKHVT